jgi:hypothetical protein
MDTTSVTIALTAILYYLYNIQQARVVVALEVRFFYLRHTQSRTWNPPV